MKLFLLLYADDALIFAESQQELQQILKLSEHYCSIWKLKVNVSKTKMYFQRGKVIKTLVMKCLVKK
jgi:hypothetical protein